MLTQLTRPYAVYREAHAEHLRQIVQVPLSVHVSRTNVTLQHSLAQNQQWDENHTISSQLERVNYQHLRQSICASDLEPVILQQYTIKEKDKDAIHDIPAKLHNPIYMLPRAKAGYACVT